MITWTGTVNLKFKLKEKKIYSPKYAKESATWCFCMPLDARTVEIKVLCCNFTISLQRIQE